MRKLDHEQQLREDFAEFIETRQVAPRRQIDEAILTRVGKDLRPAFWKIYGKFGLVQITASLATLAICPQFGFGFGRHNPFVHDLHAATSAPVFYLLCGLFFVFFGSAAGGAVLSRAEIRTVGRDRYAFFAVFSILAFLVLLTLGTEAFVVSSLTWTVGALLGHVLGFETSVRLRRVTG